MSVRSATATKTLVVKIGNNFSAEANVTANLFSTRSGIPVTLICNHWDSHGTDGALDGCLKLEAVLGRPVQRVDFGWRPRTQNRGVHLLTIPWRSVRFVYGLSVSVRIARNAAPDVIYSSQQKWDLLVATALAFALRRPQIIHLHYPPGPWLGRFVLWRLRRASHVVCVSDFISSELTRWRPKERATTTILNAVASPSASVVASRPQTRLQLRVPHDAIVVCMVARMDWMKSPLDALRAFQRVQISRPDIHFVLAGSGPLLASMQDWVEANSLESNVHLLGQRGDVSELMAASDIFLHPSALDPCPLAVLEAMAIGLPVVAYRSGGVPEEVADGDNGLLANTGDVDELAHMLMRLVDERSLRIEMGRASSERARMKFGWERAVRQLQGVLSR